MPSLAAHVSEDVAKAVYAAAKVKNKGRPGPWVTEAIEQRLERDGMMPGNPTAELLAAAQEIGVPEAVDILAKAARERKGAAA